MNRRTVPTLVPVLLVLAILVGIVGAGLGVYGLSIAGEANDKVDILIESRDASRKISCDDFNRQQKRSVAANKAQVREVFRSLTSDDDLTPEEQAGLDRLFADHDAVIEAAFPTRDCSPAGIAAYYQEDPAP